MVRLFEKYNTEVIPEMVKRFEYDNVSQVPRLMKLVINMGIGQGSRDAKLIDVAAAELALISGQKPVITKAKHSIAGFKIREGMPVGCKVTLRGKRMFEFLDRLIHVAIPRIRDFRGIPSDSFDGFGNYTFGLEDQTIFPEVNLDKVERTQGMDISIVTTPCTDEEAFEVLRLLGFPFEK
ncbi:MAG: 50S ribosomal protein L5 [Candidatus Auribacterota bacterium]|jgi:large subunit ribosomal protein L5|nr:50S ribosomal protein L5 [Candidatus Auribacterota bacterium]